MHPPLPFEHRTSAEDLEEYNHLLIEGQEWKIRDLFKRWAAQDEQRAQDQAKQRRAAEESQRFRNMEEAVNKSLQQITQLQNETEQANKNWFSKAEAAKYLGVSERTIDRKRDEGSLRGYVLEGSSTFRFKREDLDKLMQ